VSDKKDWVAVTNLLAARATRFPDRLAMNVNGAAGITYRDWQRRVSRTANGLLRAGVGRGDRIALLFAGMDWIDYAVAYLAVLSAGGCGIHLHESYPQAELERRLAEGAVQGIIHGAGLPLPRGQVAWTHTVADLDSGDETPVAVDLGPDDIADILYTSGTTGPAKGFTNPHGNLTFGRGPEGLRQFDNPTPMLAPMPLGTTSSATTVAIIALTAPAELILAPVDDIERMGELIERFRIGSIMITPRTAMGMIEARLGERHHLSTVDRIAIASAPLPPAVSRELLALYPGAQLTAAYSQSEAVPAVIVATFDPARPATLGRPAPGTELRLCDDDGEPVPTGNTGEIWLRSQAPRRRYLDRERDARVHVDGWTRTGDLGHLDEDGFLYLFDRRVDALPGEVGLVSSVAVENALYEHPAVLAAAVVAVPAADHAGASAVEGATARRVTGAEAVVVLRDPRALAELPGFLAGRLKPHERPERFHAWESLPRGVTGKVLKTQVRQRLSAQ
jgi:acyl-CoA synthetase (AMP-forming)/AMP-acid ligase II